MTILVHVPCLSVPIPTQNLILVRQPTVGKSLNTINLLKICSNRFRPLAASTDTISVSSNNKYGSKQVISVSHQIYDYILSNVREPQILRKLREETAGLPGSQMQVSPDQAQLLAMLVQVLGAHRCIEVGVYTGYSSLAVALVLPESGKLVACERDRRCLEIAKKYYERAGVSHKVDIRLAMAVDTLSSLISNGEACSYDFAFVDAEKRMYAEYFELLLQLVTDQKTVSIRDFNKKIFEDERVSTSIVPIGDGMTICRKISNSFSKSRL